MTFSPPENLKDTWAAIYRRRGADGDYTRLFDNLDVKTQRELLSFIQMSDLELPVIGGICDEDNWFALTTSRVIWSIDGARREISLSNIRNTKMDFANFRSGNDKLISDEIVVQTMCGGKYVIRIEPGSPLSGVWSVLHNVGIRNRRNMD